MASVEKFSNSAVVNQIRHIERTIQHPSNEDIDTSRIGLDYALTPDRGMTAYDYYKLRKSECDCLNRDDVKTLFGWVVTCPEDVAPEQEDLFFYNCFDFLNERYGEKNLVSCVVHKDESGRAHMHYLSIPVVTDKNGKEKICCKEVLDRRELRNFHPDLDKFLSQRGMRCGVYTGVTKQQGGNRTVREMKRERELERSRERVVSRW